MNHEKIYRLYCEANLAMYRREKANRPASERPALSPASQPNAISSMDFVSDALAHGHRLICLTVADDFSLESADIAVDHGISGAYLVRVLDRTACGSGETEGRYRRCPGHAHGPFKTNATLCRARVKAT